MMNEPDGLYTWQKDKRFRYINCSESYARAAGFDSPQAIIGKTDDDMPWRSLADFFRAGDQGVMDGTDLTRQLKKEQEIMVDRVADILVTENQLLLKNNDCIGVTGFFVDISGYSLTKKSGMFSTDKRKFYLGESFGHEYLTRKEWHVLREVLLGKSAAQIAIESFRSKRTIEAQIASLKSKFQCDTKGDLIHTAVSHGLLWILEDYCLAPNVKN